MFKTGVRVRIEEPGDLEGCTGTVTGRGMETGSCLIKLDYEMEDTDTGCIVRFVPVQAMYLAVIEAREVGR